MNGYCYKVLATPQNLDEGENECKYFYEAELILFDNNDQVDGFINLLKNGYHTNFTTIAILKL